jgi:lambda family phage portal protein
MTQIRTPTRSSSAPDLIEVSGGHGKYTALGYRSARVATREGRSYSDGSGDMHLEYDRKTLINQSRAFYRDNSIYRGVINRAVSYIVGTGFRLRVLGGEPEANQALEATWRSWYRRPDVRGLLSGVKGARMVCREAMVAGDTGCLKTDQGLIQYVEAEQITDGRSGSGIKLDEYGRPISYSICPYNAQGRLATSKVKAVAAADFLFITDPSRPSQTRGEPILQSAFPMVHRINDICDAEALARQLLSRLVLTVTQEMADEAAFAGSKVDTAKAGTDTTADVAARLQEFDYAIVFHAKPGEKAEAVKRDIPGADFTDTLRIFLRLLGLPIGLPLELILLDWSQANYSQSRAVLEQAYQTFCDWQQLLEDCYYQPLFEWRLPALCTVAGLTVSDELRQVEWIKPSFPWIDQLKEAEAHAVKLDRCLTLHAHVLKELNLDREDVVRARVLEVTDAITQAKAIATATGVKVPWEIFCGLAAPKPTAAAPKGQAGAGDNADNADEDDKDKEEPDDA